MTSENAIKIFLSKMRREGYSDTTIGAYRFDLEKMNIYIKERRKKKEIEISRIDKETVGGWIDKCLEMGNSKRTVARKLAVAKSFFRFLSEEGEIEKNPVERIKLPKIGKRLPESLSQEEIREIIEVVSKNEREYLRNRAVLLILYSTGMRVSELVSLKIEDVNIEQHYVRIAGKGSKERLLPLVDSAYKSIVEYLEEREKKMPESVFPKAPVFITRSKKPLTVRMIQYMVEKYGIAAGVQKHVYPHLLRHSIASHLVEEGCHIEAVRQTLGHEDLATTSIYLKTSSRFIRDEHRKHNPTDKIIKAKKN